MWFLYEIFSQTLKTFSSLPHYPCGCRPGPAWTEARLSLSTRAATHSPPSPWQWRRQRCTEWTSSARTPARSATQGGLSCIASRAHTEQKRKSSQSHDNTVYGADHYWWTNNIHHMFMFIPCMKDLHTWSYGCAVFIFVLIGIFHIAVCWGIAQITSGSVSAGTRLTASHQQHSVCTEHFWTEDGLEVVRL